MPAKKKRIVLFDGDCGFCNRSVSFILRHEKNHEISFSAIQSSFSSSLLKSLGVTNIDLNTFYFIEDGNVYEKSSAALKVSSFLKFPYSMLVVCWITPRFIRDAVYDRVARNRHKLAEDYCFVPTENQKGRLIADD